jgi:hypothetical protein
MSLVYFPPSYFPASYFPDSYFPAAAGPAEDPFAGLLCTDEDVAEVAQGDYAGLVAKSSTKAGGDDGTFSAGARWTLTSPTEPFDERGVGPGHVCALSKKGTGGALIVNDLLGVAAASAAGCTLKRLGQPAGRGRPPGPAAGVTGVTFSFPTVEPLIRLASAELRRQLRVKDDSWLEAVTDVRQAIIYWVLAQLYLQQYRDSSVNSAWRTKSKEYQALYDATRLSLERTYGIAVSGRRPATGRLADDPSWRVPSLGD